MRLPRFAALLLATLVLAPAGAATTSMGPYARDPVAHDDLGSVAEPDRRTTSVLGVALANRVVDHDLDGVASPDGVFGLRGPLAPGCTDDTGRQPAGACGLHSSGAGSWVGVNLGLLRPGLAGTSGMTGSAAPGSFTPTKATQVRFLDARITTQLPWGSGGYYDVNRRLAESGTSAALAGLDPALAGPFATGSAGAWAWYGTWQDKNGNGVIDHLADLGEHDEDDPSWQVPAGEEFRWSGNCLDFDGGFRPASVAKGYCALDREAAQGATTRMVAWLYPGNHHATCGGALDPLHVTCPLVPADAPGRQGLHLLAAAGAPVCGTLVGLACDPRQRDLDAADAAWGGDPLLGPQGSVAYDQEYRDWTGDHSLLLRHWSLGSGQPLYLYDQGLLATLLHVTAVGCREDPSRPQRVDPASCRFVDVDAYGGASPVLADLLDGTVRPAGRANWVALRGDALAAGAGADAWIRSSAADPAPTLGPLDDAAVDPGLAREPNDPGDAYPAAQRGTGPDPETQFHGWYNNYAAHRAAPRAFGDLVPQRALVVHRPVGVLGGCVLCTAGMALESPYAGEAPGTVALRAPGDHRPTLGPGQYIFTGVFGTWHDRPQSWTEAFLDASCSVVPTSDLGTCGGGSGLVRAAQRTAPPDGWVGNVVNSTGAYAYRGYGPQECTTDQGPGAKPYAHCHPYHHGTLRNPQGYAPGAPAHGEWVGRCDKVAGRAVEVRPLDGTWSVPVFVWRHHLDGIDPLDLHGVQDFTGTTGPIRLEAMCATGAQEQGLVRVLDLLVLPLGNAGETLTTTITVHTGSEAVRDTDTYAGWS
jgi:hypothetical protein